MAHLLAALAALAAGACADTVDRFGFIGTGGVSGGASSGGSAASTAGSAGTGQGSASGGGTGASGGSSGSGGTAGVDVCQSLDLLFVVDNEPDNQLALANLLANIGTMADYLRGGAAAWSDDFHVGFVRTFDTPGACNVAGALSAEPTVGAACATASGGPFGTQEDGDGLGDVLGCLAQIPEATPTGPPPVALAAARAMGVKLPQDTFPDAACNAGFVRSAGVHMVVLISSKDDPGGGAGSPGAPAEWAAAFAPLADPQAGSELGIFGLVPDPAMLPGCAPPADTLKAWIGMHTFGGTSDWCLLQSSPTQWVFDAAAAITELCP